MGDSPDAALLRLLRAAGTRYAPREALPGRETLAVSLASLAGAGYVIEHDTALGCRLVSAPDRLIADDILSRLPVSGWVRQVLVFQSTASTNDIVNSLARDGAPEGIAVFAEEQTAGRGRLGRKWQSPPGLGLWFSILLRPQLPPQEWPRLTLWLAYALARGIHAVTGLDPTLKWPNDLFLGGRKVAGILVETSLGQKPFATAGIGINVNHPSFPTPLDATATSLRIQTGSPIDRNALAATILDSIDAARPQLDTGFDQVLAWATTADYLLGRRVSASIGATTCNGIAQGLDSDGALLILTDSGKMERLTSGEVTRFSAL